MYKMFTLQTIKTPHLIGKYVHDVMPYLTQHNLNLRLIEEKEDADIPEGIIINQIPTSNSTIKPYQTIFIITTKKPPAKRTPSFICQTIEAIMNQCKKNEIIPHIYYVPHSYPHGTCFAQYPQQNDPLEKNKITLYISSGDNKPIIWPNFIGKTVQEVTEFLHEYEIQPHIIFNTVHNAEAIIIDQRPTAGTLLTLDEKKTVTVHLRAHHYA